MSDIYYGLIVFPLIFFATLIFIFQSGLTEIEGQQFISNCPFPVFMGNVTDVGIEGLNVVYNVTYSSASNATGSLFQCSYTSEPTLLSVNEITKEYGATFFDFIPYGWLGYVADWITQLGQKIQAQLTVIWLFIDAPAQVTNLAFFSYIQIFLVALMGFGGFLAIRGGTG